MRKEFPDTLLHNLLVASSGSYAPSQALVGLIPNHSMTHAPYHYIDGLGLVSAVTRGLLPARAESGAG